tara:strand:- start:11545 stop:11919 length:375 start_codon:yes stop_codon:yes gene_type:complete
MKTINNFLKELNDSKNSDLDLAYYYNDGDTFNQYKEAIYQSICENQIIYYSRAIEYLKNNDPSLRESLSIALELCYNTENLNSEVLATLLYQQDLHNEFSGYWSEIETYFQKYEGFINSLDEEE